MVGKTQEKYLSDGIDIFLKRLNNYTKLEWFEFKEVKNFSNPEDCKKKEGEQIFAKLRPEDFLVILDENGITCNSTDFALHVEQWQVRSIKHVVFLIGGAFGIHDNIKSRANFQLSLSKLTFSHQMVRLFFAEQLYRAYTIINNEKYHNP